MESTTGIISVFWIGTFVILFLVFGFLFMVVFYQRQFAKIRQKEAEVLLKTALSSEKMERQRIAKDLHDSVQGDINAIRNYVALLSKKLTEQPEKDLLEVIRSALQQTAENTRLISYKLMPPLLETNGFCAAVLDHFNRLSTATGKKFSIQADMPRLVIPSDQAYELFRIVQEFTQNMLKYGAIAECKLFMYETEKGLSIELVDDGVPFNFKTSYLESNGSGLYNIKSRLRSIGAAFQQREVVEGNHFVITLNKDHD
jgi:signal transduction histidine kinase